MGATLQLADGLDRLLYGERDVLSLDTAQLLEDMELSFSLDRKPATAAEYRRFVEHFVVFVGTLGHTLITARQTHVKVWLAHLQSREGRFGELVESCPVCREAGEKAGRYGPSYAKRHLAALRAAYKFMRQERIPLDGPDPTADVAAPKVITGGQYVPSRDDVHRLMAHTGTPLGRLIVRLGYYAPARRAEHASMRYCDIDENRVWTFIGKGGKRHHMPLHMEVMRALRDHAAWQQRRAAARPAIARALASDETAYVLLNRWGRPMTPGQITRILKRHAVHAGVGLMPAAGQQWDAVNGMTSKVSPHALRRAWASHVLNDPNNPVPLDVVSATLNHSQIATTRAHYAFTDDERVRDALTRHRL